MCSPVRRNTRKQWYTSAFDQACLLRVQEDKAVLLIRWAPAGWPSYPRPAVTLCVRRIVQIQELCNQLAFLCWGTYRSDLHVSHEQWVFDRPFWCLNFLPFVYGYPSSSPRAHRNPNESVPTLRYTRRHGPGFACTAETVIISRLILVIRSHASISACVKEDQLALCTRHGRTSALFWEFF